MTVSEDCFSVVGMRFDFLHSPQGYQKLLRLIRCNLHFHTVQKAPTLRHYCTQRVVHD